MHIGIVAPPWVAVPPPAYGGTESVIDLLARGLSDRGHDVRLFTTGDATCPVIRGSLVGKALGTDRTDDEAILRHHVEAAYGWLSGSGPLDVIHDHTQWGPLWQSVDLPVVTTFHNPIDAATLERWQRFPDNVTAVAISAAHRGSAALRPAEVIHHGLDTASVPFGNGRGDHLLFLGRMTPDKGVEEAIAIAREADLPLLIAAKAQRREEREFLERRVEPLLGGGVRYLGEARPAEKLRLLASARALLNPIQWPEPFGLVMVEALAAGTPVITTPHGAAPEIVTHGRTGYICRTRREAVAACHAVTALSRSLCREEAVRRFDARVMVSAYEELFQRLTRTRSRSGDRRARTAGLFARRIVCPDCARPVDQPVFGADGEVTCADCADRHRLRSARVPSQADGAVRADPGAMTR